MKIAFDDGYSDSNLAWQYRLRFAIGAKDLFVEDCKQFAQIRTGAGIETPLLTILSLRFMRHVRRCRAIMLP